MKQGKLKGLFLVIIAVLVVGLIYLSGCTGNAENGFTVPTFTEPEPPPIEVTVGQLYEEYMTDEAAAGAKYKEERLLFSRVTVEKVSNHLLDHRANEAADIYIMTDSVKFKPRYSSDIDFIREGFVVDIVGEAQGLIWGVLYIKDCWIMIIEGDGYTAEEIEEIY